MELFFEDSILVLAAVVLDLLLGDPRALPHPVVWIGRLIAFLEPRLRRLIGNARVAGIALLVVTVAITYLCGFLLLKAAHAVSPQVGFVMGIYIAWVSVAARSLHMESGKVAAALERGDLPGARTALSYIVGRETAHLEEPEIIRAAIETVAENTSDGVIAPLFYLMIGGPALAIAYKAVNTLDSMVGYKNDRYIDFGWASARFDDLANYFPARLTGVLMVLSAPICTLSGREAWRILTRDSHSHSSPNSGFPEAAAAGALGVRLGGASHYFGRLVHKPTIGDPFVPLSLSSYRGAVRLMYCSEALLLIGWQVLGLILNQ